MRPLWWISAFLLCTASCRYEPGELVRDATCPCADGFTCIDGRCERPATEPLPSHCDGSFLFCDDFEGGSLFAWADIMRTGGRVETNTAVNRWGRFGMLLDLPQTAAIVSASSRPFTTTTRALHTRAWIRIEAPGSIVKTPVLAFVIDATRNVTFGIGPPPGADSPTMEYPFIQALGSEAWDDRPIPRGTWLCVELSLERTDVETSFVARIDGEEAVRMALDPTQVDPAQLHQLFVELEDYSGGSARAPTTVYVDDVSVDDASMPFPCTGP